MRRNTFWMVALVLACGGGSSAGSSGLADSLEVFASDLLEQVEESDLDVAHDPGRDLSEEALAPEAPKDVPVADPVPEEAVQLPEPIQDVGLDEMVPDDGSAPDDTSQAIETWGPDTAGMSDTAAACTYVVAGVCEKVIKKCDDQLLNVIPDGWLDACTNFLLGNGDIIKAACSQLDNVQTTDPTILMIQKAGPTVLKQCVDNYQCNLESILALIPVLKPLFEGQKPQVGDILALVAKLCLPQ